MNSPSQSRALDIATYRQGREGAGRPIAALAAFVGLLLFASFALSVLSGTAQAATGSLTATSCLEDLGRGTSCTDLDGLEGSQNSVVSKDGKSLYAVSRGDGALLVFDRNKATGDLTFSQCFQDVGRSAPCAFLDGLGGLRDLDISDDGKSVYAVTLDDDSFFNFSRDTGTGLLTFSQCFELTGRGTSCVDMDSLEHNVGVDVSPDGTSVYVAHDNPFSSGGLHNFDRDPSTGLLTFNECFEDVGGGTPCIDLDGLADTDGVVVSPDSSSVYAVSGFDDSALVVFDRSTSTGSLTFSQCFEDVGQGTACADLPRLESLVKVAISPDGTSVLATSLGDQALHNFQRDPATGKLTYSECFAPGGTGCTVVAGTQSPFSVKVSPDGLSVYLGSITSDTVTLFTRNLSSGLLTKTQCFEDQGKGTPCTDTAGLDAPLGLSISPDGRSVYSSAGDGSALVTFSRQSTPETSILSGPAGATADSTPTFTLGTDTTGAALECKVDEGAWNDCSSPYTTFALADGEHEFLVRSVDQVGNTDPTPDTRNFTVDTRAPESSVDSGPSGVTSDATPTYTFSSDAPDLAGFECRIDTGAWSSCASPYTTTSLTDGEHTFRVRAIDAVGNVETSPAVELLTVDTSVPADTTAPESTIDSGPSGTTADSTPTYLFSSDAPDLAGFECRIDTGTWSACSSPHTTTALSDGDHSFRVRATDLTGNVESSPAVELLTVDTSVPADTTAPDTEMLSTPRLNLVGNKKKVKLTFKFKASEQGASFECRLDSGDFKTCTSPRTIGIKTTKKAKTHRFYVRAVDTSGNVDFSSEKWVGSVKRK